MLIRYKINANTLVEDGNGPIFYYYEISDNEKEELEKILNIDSYNLQSSLDPDEVSRIEIEDDRISLIWKIPTALSLGGQSSFSISSLGFFIEQNRLILILKDFIPYFREKMPFSTNSIYDIVVFFLYISIKHFIEHLKIIKLLSREIQSKINESMDNQYLLHMFNLSEILIYYLDSIDSNSIVLKKFLYYLKNHEKDVNLDFLDDIIIENEQASRQAEIYSQVFAGLMDARSGIVNNNMNILIKNLTIINIIFLPLNLIASIFGMSEWTAITGKLPWYISYGIFFVFMLLVGWVTMKYITNMQTKKVEPLPGKIKKISNNSKE